MIPLKPEQLTRELINDWANNNPTIRACLTLHLRGDLTYEQALTAMAHYLASQNKELIDEKIESFFKQSPAMSFQTSPLTVKQICSILENQIMPKSKPIEEEG